MRYWQIEVFGVLTWEPLRSVEPYLALNFRQAFDIMVKGIGPLTGEELADYRLRPVSERVA